MILKPPEKTAEKKKFSCRKMGFSHRKMYFPAGKCRFLQKMHFPAEKCAFSCRKTQSSGGRKPQEIAGGLQGSRIKNASQLPQDLRCCRTPGAPIRKILLYPGLLPCLVLSWPQIMQIRSSFRSRSHLVLDADHALDFYLRTHRIGANPEKSDLANFRGPD